jgi:ribosomal protein S18 acetylase RimI-like enzyme
MCYLNEECVGQIILRRNWNKYCFIEDIAVSSEHRKKSIGKKLIDLAINWAKTNGMQGLMLETQDNNLSA